MPLGMDGVFQESDWIWILFGRLNLVISLGIVLLLGLRQGWDPRRWTLVVLGMLGGASVGAALFPSIIPVFLGAVVGAGLVRILVEFREPMGDLLALFFFISIGIGRIGCFLAGCCFGSVTDLPWAVHYGSHSVPFLLHAWRGELAADASCSLPIHPIQLYESALLLLVLVPLVFRLRKRWQHRNLILPLGMGLYFLLRFGLEFLRDSSNTLLVLPQFAGLSLFQWLLLLVGFLAVGSSLLLERRSPRENPVSSPSDLGISLDLGLLSGLGLTVMLLAAQVPPILTLLFVFALVPALIVRWQLARDLIDSSVLATAFSLTLLLALLVTLGGFSGSLLHAEAGALHPRLRLRQPLYTLDVPSGKLVRVGNESLSTTRLTQLREWYGLFTPPADTLADSGIAGPEVPVSGTQWYGAGSVSAYSYIPACGGERRYVNETGMLLGLEHRTVFPRRVSYLGIRGDILPYRIRTRSDPFHETGTMGSVNLYHSTDWSWLGIGVGLFAGNSHGEWVAVPSAYLRLGKKKFYAEAGWNDRYHLVPGWLSGHLNIGFSDARLGIMNWGNAGGGFFLELPEQSYRDQFSYRLLLAGNAGDNLSGFHGSIQLHRK